MRNRLLTALLLLAASAQAGVVERSENFYVDAPNEVCAKRVLYDAERARVDFCRKWFGHDPVWKAPVPIVVKIRPFGDNGYMKTIGNSLVYIELIGKDDLEAEEVLRHEVGHVVIHNELGDAPRWLHEGVCVADELLYGDYPRRFRDKLGHLNLWFLLPLDGIPPWFDGDAFYGQSASLICFIRQRWGIEGLWMFYRLGHKHGWEAAAAGACHMPLSLLEKEWTEWTHSLESPYPRSLRGTPVSPSETCSPLPAVIPLLPWAITPSPRRSSANTSGPRRPATGCVNPWPDPPER